MPCRSFLGRFMDETGKRRIPRRAHVVSGYCRLSRPSKPLAGVSPTWNAGTNIACLGSKAISAKRLCAWAHEELSGSVPRETPSRAGPGGRPWLLLASALVAFCDGVDRSMTVLICTNAVKEDRHCFLMSAVLGQVYCLRTFLAKRRQSPHYCYTF